MHPLLKDQLLELKHDANTHQMSRELILKALTETEMVDTNNYRHRLSIISDDVEADLRRLMQETSLDSIFSLVESKATFNHAHGHNKLAAIRKKEDWYFDFEDPELIFDNTRFSLSELPLESKLLIIDLLQK